MNCTHWSQRLLPACPPEVAPKHARLQSQSQEKGTLGHLQVERGQQEVRRCGAQWCPGSVHRSSRLDIKPDKYIVKVFNNISNKINSVSYLFAWIYVSTYSFKVSSDIIHLSLPQVKVSKGEGGVHTWSCTPSVLSRIVEL